MNEAFVHWRVNLSQIADYFMLRYGYMNDMVTQINQLCMARFLFLATRLIYRLGRESIETHFTIARVVLAGGR